MNRIKMRWDRLTIAERIIFCRSVKEKLTGNPHFPHLIPVFAAFILAIDELEIAQAHTLQGGIHDTAFRNLKDANLYKLTCLLAAYVFAESKGDHEMIISTGFDVAKPSIRRPYQLAVSPGKLSGSVVLTSESKNGALHFWQYYEGANTPDENDWVDYPETSKARFIMTGLETGKKYWFREMKLFINGRTNWTDPVCTFVG